MILPFILHDSPVMNGGLVMKFCNMYRSQGNLLIQSIAAGRMDITANSAPFSTNCQFLILKSTYVILKQHGLMDWPIEIIRC